MELREAFSECAKDFFESYKATGKDPNDEVEMVTLSTTLKGKDAVMFRVLRKISKLMGKPPSALSHQLILGGIAYNIDLLTSAVAKEFDFLTPFKPESKPEL